jgi:hypothetical protein
MPVEKTSISAVAFRLAMIDRRQPPLGPKEVAAIDRWLHCIKRCPGMSMSIFKLHLIATVSLNSSLWNLPSFIGKLGSIVIISQQNAVIDKVSKTLSSTIPR